MKTESARRTWTNLPTSKWYAVWVFGVVLSVEFVTETAIMASLPWYWPESEFRLTASLLDASILTATTALVMWWLVVRPLRLLVANRQRLLGKLVAAQEDERRRIARDLHDEVGQLLTTLLVGLQSVEGAESLQLAKHHARSLQSVTASAHDEVRRLSHGLRPAVLDQLGLRIALERLAEDVQRHHGLQVRLSLNLDGRRLSRAVESTVYRSAQEALSNTARHANATRASLRLARRGRMLHLAIEDDGRGHATARGGLSDAGGPSLGVNGIVERAELLGGHAEMHSHADRGTTLQVRLPLAEEADSDDSSIAGG
jgi:signal transduction histidine kinase